MTRKSAGFVPKKAHKKSRGGCTTCKRKKVKCDEALPKCHYCALREFECSYPEQQRQSITPRDSSSPSLSPLSQESTDSVPDFQSLEIPSQLVPAVFTSSGQLTMTDFELLHQYKTSTWETLHVRKDEPIQWLNREWIPQKCIEHPYLLYTILSITAFHSKSLTKSGHTALLSAKYRHKAFEKYNKALQNISNDNYETLLMTSLLMQLMVPPPDLPCDDTAILDWISAFLMMSQGLRILASLKWSSGLEKLSVFPLFRRELRILPPPPDIQLPPDQSFYAQPGPPGNTPEQPDPPVMYNGTPPPSPINSGVNIDVENLPFRPKELMRANSPYTPKSWDGKPTWQLPAPAFLPPPLMALLRTIVKPSDTGPIDLHRSTLLPVLHALSPIFLSLYHYHLNDDATLRITVFPTFLMPEFHALVKAKEPRALIIMGWWFAFVRLLPNNWWIKDYIPRLLQAASNSVIRSNSKVFMDAIEGAFIVVRLAESEGVEVAAKSVFHGWEGVHWEASVNKASS